MAGSAMKLVELVEACYRVDVSDADWLRGITDAAAPMLDRGLGVAAYMYDARDPSAFRMLEGCFPPGVDLDAMRAFLASVPAEFVEQTWFAGPPCGFASQVDGFAELAPTLRSFGGARDVIALAGRDPTGFGVWLGALLPKVAVPARKELSLFSRVAAHLAASYRVRRSLAGARVDMNDADAVLRPGGKIAHVRETASHKGTRSSLRNATIHFDRARSHVGRKEPEKALTWWQGLVDARWTLLDHFDHDGQRYVVARRNIAEIAGLGDLTERERQVVAYAALGHDNKVIAYELGIAASTVRVLLHRAATKLGANGRAELVSRFKSKRKD